MPARHRIHNPFSRSRQSRAIRYEQANDGRDRTSPHFDMSSPADIDVSFRDELFLPQPAADRTSPHVAAELPAPLSAEEVSMTIPDHFRAASHAEPAELPSDHEVGPSSVDWEGLEAELQPHPRGNSRSFTPPPPPYSYDPPTYDPLASLVITSNNSNVTADNIPTEDEHELTESEHEPVGSEHEFVQSLVVAPDEEWTDPITAECRDIIRYNFSTSDPESGIAEYYEYRRNTRATPSYRWFLNCRYASLVLQADLPAQVFHVGLRQRDIRVRKQSFNQVLAYLFGDCLVFDESLFTSVMRDPNGRPGVRISDSLKHGLNVIESWPIRFCELKQACKKKDLNLMVDVCTHISDGVEENVRYELKFKSSAQRQILSSEIRMWLDDVTASRQVALAEEQELERDTQGSPVPEELNRMTTLLFNIPIIKATKVNLGHLPNL